MEADFDHVCQKVGISVKLPRLNRSKHNDYRTYYTDRGRELVERTCKADIEYFGYRFDPEAGVQGVGVQGSGKSE